MSLSYLDSLMVELPANLARLQANNLSSTNITTQNIDILGNLTVYGNVSALSGYTIVQSTVTNTSSLSVISDGIFPALFVEQGISNPIIAIFKNDSGNKVLIDNTGLKTVNLSAYNATINTNIITTNVSAISLSADTLSVKNIVFSQTNGNIFNNTTVSGTFVAGSNATVVGNLSTNGNVVTPRVILPVDGSGQILNNFTVLGNITVQGRVTALSGISAINTFATSTTALSVINIGTGPAFYVYNAPDTNSVATFVGDNVEILKINNSNPAGKTGVEINQGLDIVTGNVRLFAGVLSASGGTSTNWTQGYNTGLSYASLSGDISTTLTLVRSNSGGWNTSLTAVSAYQNDWNYVTTIVRDLSAGWNAATNTATDYRSISASFNIFYQNSALFLSGFNPVKFTFYGNGSANTFTLTANSVSKNPNNFRVDVNGVLQEPDVDYVLSGYDVIFTTTPLLNEKIVIVANNTVGVYDIIPSAGSVTTDKIAYQAVIADKIADSNVTTIKLANEAVTTDKLALTSVTTDKIFNSAVTTNKIALTAVTTDKIALTAVTTDKLATNAVTTDKIALTAVTTEKLALSCITSDRISVSAVLTDNIANLAVTTQKLNNQAVTTEKIADIAVTEDKANFTGVSQIELNSGGMSVGRVGQGIVNPIDNATGVSLINQGYIAITRNNPVAYFNRLSSDGPIVTFYRQGSAVGNIAVTTSGTSYNTTSDYRLKENVTDLTNGLQTVKSLLPRKFTWKSNQTEDVGFIAHELENIIPSAVTGNKDEVDHDNNIVPQTIDTHKLIPILVSAIQELAGELQKLKDK